MSAPEDKPPETSRRSLIKAAVYVTPAILTLPANTAYASYGSSWKDHEPPGQSKRKKGKKLK